MQGRTINMLARALATIASPALLALSAAGCGSGPEPSTVEIPALKDNTLYEQAKGLLSNGAGQHILAGKNGRGEIRRTVIAFDVAAEIPAGATIKSASLTLHLSRTAAGPQTVSVHGLLADWGEGASDASDSEGGGGPPAAQDATWLHTFFDTATWATPGGDYLPTASAEQTVALDGSSYTWTSDKMAADVQAWVDNPSSNFGWLVRGGEDENGTTKRFDSKDNPEAAIRPVLRVEFTAPEGAVIVATAGPPDGAPPAVAPSQSPPPVPGLPSVPGLPGLPALPAIYSGTAIAGGSRVPSGYKIVARIDGYESQPVEVKDGALRGLVIGPPSADFSGKTVTFYLGDVVAEETEVFQALSVPQLKDGWVLTFPRLPGR